MIFLIAVVVVWLGYIFLYYHVKGERFSFSNALLPLLLFSIIITFDLGINYLAGAMPSLNDGIALHGFFAPAIFNDHGWSVDLFRQYYHVSLLTSCVLLIAYMVALIFKNVEQGDGSSV